MRADPLIAKQTRADKLQASLATAQKLRALLDADVSELLDAQEAALVETILAAKTDESRREATFELKAWRRIRTIIRNTAQAEPYAVKQLKELAHGNR